MAWSSARGPLSVVLAVTGLALAAPATAAAAAPRCTVKGTPKADVLKGTRKADVICGLGGNDRVVGGKGNDVLVGGPGKDVLVGGPGRDQLQGNGGDDRLEGGAGKDADKGGPGRDVVAYTAAPSGVEVDLAEGETSGGAGVDALSGIEDVVGSAHADVLTGDEGPNQMMGGGEGDTIEAGAGNDMLAGNGGDDSLSGGEGDDSLSGGVGDDALDGGPGKNVCLGGTGDDSLALSCDGSPPKLEALSFTPDTVDSFSGAQSILITARISDDLAGNAGAGFSSSPSQVAFVSPSGQQSVFAIFSDNQRTSGTPQDGTYTATINIPRFSEQGTWTIRSFLLVDQVGNTSSLDAGRIAAAGHPTTFSQTGAGDTAAPALVSMSLAPAAVDSSNAKQSISITVRITDDAAGNAGAGFSSSPSQVAFVSPSGRQTVFAIFSDNQRTSGTPQDGTYTATFDIPRFSEQGTWTVRSFLLVDQAGNTTSLTGADLAGRGFPASFDQTGPGDSTPPVLASFSLSPSAINTAGSAQPILLTARITDDLAGNAGAGFSSSPSQVRFVSPSGQQSATAMFSDNQRTSGSPTDGTYEATLNVPQFAECGDWTVQGFLLVDQAGNTRSASSGEMSAAGMPVSFRNC